jgi:hypothetical protein
LAPLADPTRLAAYKDALANWTYDGYVRFELNEEAYRWLKRSLEGITTKEIARLMHEHVAAGGEIDETKETRPEWSDQFPFHHDLRFSIGGREIYIETRLAYRLPLKADESSIIVVNIHDR